MFYKIINKECDIYKKLRVQREAELTAKSENKKILEESFPSYERFSGYRDQGAQRIAIPVGFYFTNPDEVDRTAWMEDKKRKGLFYPSKRYSKGKEMQRILNSLKSFSSFKLMDLMGLECSGIGEFSTPYLEMVPEGLVLRLDDKFNPKDENFIEITSKEALELLDGPQL